VTNPKKLILYVGYIAPTIYLLQPPTWPASSKTFHCSISCRKLMSINRISPLIFIHSHKYPTHNVPILQACLLLLISKSRFKRLLDVLHLSILYFGQVNPSHYSPLPFSSHTPFFNSFQCITLYPLPSQTLCFIILLMLYRSLFLSLLP
jgi:hypothetical protein